MTWGMPPIDGLSRPRPPLNQRVWVHLDRAFGPPPAEPVDVPAGVELTGRVVGTLREWLRATDGRWLAKIDTALPRPGAIEGSYPLHGAVVPADALEPVPDLPPRT